jgi:hypothetical protein
MFAQVSSLHSLNYKESCVGKFGSIAMSVGHTCAILNRCLYYLMSCKYKFHDNDKSDIYRLCVVTYASCNAYQNKINKPT